MKTVHILNASSNMGSVLDYLMKLDRHLLTARILDVSSSLVLNHCLLGHIRREAILYLTLLNKQCLLLCFKHVAVVRIPPSSGGIPLGIEVLEQLPSCWIGMAHHYKI